MRYLLLFLCGAGLLAIAIVDAQALLGAIPLALLAIGRIWFSPRTLKGE